VIRAPGARPVRAARNAPCMPTQLYRFVVEGELSGRVEPAFETLTLTHERGNTVLVGPVRDQAELQGLLQRLTDFGLTLLSATALEESGKPREPA
jgi:hypothetical protein